MLSKDLKSMKRALNFKYEDHFTIGDIGTTKSLIEIHSYLFSGIFEYATKFRTKDISKQNFRFASSLYLKEVLKTVEQLEQDTFDKIITKYVEMNIVHPFMDGNGRSMRIWLDLILKKELNQCIDWTKVDKVLYLQAMERSPVNTLELTHLLNNALTSDINNKTIFNKGIRQSYYYEIED